MKSINLSEEKLSTVPTKMELYKMTEAFRNIFAEGAIYGSRQV